MTRWLFLPVDDRPITSRFPALIAPLGEIELLGPPRELLGRFLTPGDAPALADWLVGHAPGCEGVIASIDMLAYGGLIASRTPEVGLADALARLRTLERLKAAGLTVLASSVLMRLGITTSDPESARHHDLLVRWSQAAAVPPEGGDAHHAERLDEVAALEREVPPGVLEAYRRVRARNHRVNGAAVDLVAAGVIDFLLLLQEDCTPRGVHRQEQAELAERIASSGTSARVRMLPGTDEGAMLLLSRAALLGRAHALGRARRALTAPAFGLAFGREETADLPAPYEDRPLRETAAQQVEAAGARLAPGGTPPGEDAIELFINTPVRRYGDAFAASRSADALDDVCDGSPGLIAAIAARLAAGAPAAVADVALANGADPLFTDRLLRELPWTRLHGYAAWNTAGNTLGTAVAMAVLRHLDGGRNERVHQESLLVRLLDDYCYETLIRGRLNPWLAERGWNHLHLEHGHAEASARVEDALRDAARRLHGLGPAALGYRLRRFSASLPWPRTFEVDIDLELSADAV